MSMKASAKRATIALMLTAVVTALSASAALAGSFSIVSPGTGETTATCVGPQFGETPNLNPWTPHFVQEGLKGVVTHDLACDE